MMVERGIVDGVRFNTVIALCEVIVLPRQGLLHSGLTPVRLAAV